MHGAVDQLVPGAGMQRSVLSRESGRGQVLGSPEVVQHWSCSSVAGWPLRQVSLEGAAGQKCSHGNRRARLVVISVAAFVDGSTPP